MQSLPVTCFYLLLAWAIVAALPERAWSVKTQALVVIGFFGLWRYLWQAIHAVRHIIYRHKVFPRLRDEAMALEEKYPERLYIMVPSYKEEFQVSQLVFEAIIREAQTVPSRVLVCASVGSEEEVEFISKVVNSAPGGSDVDVMFMYQHDEGKRVAMGYALRAIARDFNDPVSWHPDAANDCVVFMDGDTLLEPGTLRKTLPYFRANPKLGALTTDNLGVSPNATGIFNDWYAVKFAQRNHMFQSHSLSKRVLTITGRFSVYRASAVVNEEFIRFLEADHLDHWLFGRFRFLMGDDKSTWYHLLKEGMEMLYVPDVTAVALEMRQTRFFRTTLSLMFRWYGNMLRNNWRAVKLGPKPMGGFIWWCIVDQRLSSFTPLIGPVSVLLLSIFDSWFYLAFYLSWIILTRLVMMWIYVLQGMRLRSLHIPLILYNQWVGAALKIYSMHSLDMQSWHKLRADEPSAEDSKKQRSRGDEFDPDKPGHAVLRNAVRGLLLSLNVAMLLTVCGLASGVLAVPGLSDLSYYRTQWRQGGIFATAPLHAESFSRPELVVTVPPDSGAVRRAIAAADPDQPLKIQLPAGTIDVREPIIVDRDNVSIVGAGEDATIFRSSLRSDDARAVIAVRGRMGPVVGVTREAATAGDRVLQMDGWPEDATHLWIGAPNDAALFKYMGDTNWRRSEPWIRRFLVEVSGHGDGYVILGKGLPLPYPAGAEVRAARLVSGVRLSRFSVEQRVPGLESARADARYENLAPEHAVDGVRFDWAAGSSVSDVAIRMAGSHPLVFENSLGVTAKRLRIDGAWNKGKGGHGYVRFARSHGCELVDSEVRNIRHLAFQWLASDNVVRDCILETDVNFHGGYSRDNVVTGSRVEPPATHPWGAVTRMPEGGADWAPPDGPGNVVEGY